MVKRHDSKNPGLIQDIFVPLKVENKTAVTSSYSLGQIRPYTEHASSRPPRNSTIDNDRRAELHDPWAQKPLTLRPDFQQAQSGTLLSLACVPRSCRSRWLSRISRTARSSPALYPSKSHPHERDESGLRRSTPLAFHGCLRHLEQPPLRTHPQESTPCARARSQAGASCSQSSARTSPTQVSPREQWRQRDKGKLQRTSWYA